MKILTSNLIVGTCIVYFITAGFMLSLNSCNKFEKGVDVIQPKTYPMAYRINIGYAAEQGITEQKLKDLMGAFERYFNDRSALFSSPMRSMESSIVRSMSLNTAQWCPPCCGNFGGNKDKDKK